MKKLAGLVAVVALFVVAVAPASAMWFWPETVVDVDNHARVTNMTQTKAYSGEVELGGMMLMGGNYTTGAAFAYAQVGNQVNYTEVGCATCADKVYVDNHAKVFNWTYTKAKTGDVEVGGKFVGCVTATTGPASAYSYVNNFVNTNLIGD